MGAEYQLRIIDTTGLTQAVITDYLDLAYTRVVNEPGLCSFVLDENNSGISTIAFNSQVEVWRRNASIGLDWTRDFIGIIRTMTWSTDQSTRLTVTAPGIMSMLGWNIVAFKAGVSNRSLFIGVTGDRVMSRIVQYNCTSSTDTNRIRVATSSSKISGLYSVAIETPSGAGNTINYSCGYDNVLTALQDIQPITGGDFDLVKTGAATFEYRWYVGQLGTDLTASLFFSIERGNMANPSFTSDRAIERTISIVAGQGEESDRFVTLKTSTDYNVSSRAFEMYSNGGSMETVDELKGLGDRDLKERKALESFSFSALQAPNAYYGVHYTLGDLVTATYRGQNYTQKVSSVAIQFDSSNGESINVGMTNE